jgi:hypothetical protein
MSSLGAGTLNKLEGFFSFLGSDIFEVGLMTANNLQTNTITANTSNIKTMTGEDVSVSGVIEADKAVRVRNASDNTLTGTLTNFGGAGEFYLLSSSANPSSSFIFALVAPSGNNTGCTISESSVGGVLGAKLAFNKIGSLNNPTHSRQIAFQIDAIDCFQIIRNNSTAPVNYIFNGPGFSSEPARIITGTSAIQFGNTTSSTNQDVALMTRSTNRLVVAGNGTIVDVTTRFRSRNAAYSMEMTATTNLVSGTPTPIDWGITVPLDAQTFTPGSGQILNPATPTVIYTNNAGVGRRMVFVNGYIEIAATSTSLFPRYIWVELFSSTSTSSIRYALNSNYFDVGVGAINFSGLIPVFSSWSLRVLALTSVNGDVVSSGWISVKESDAAPQF